MTTATLPAPVLPVPFNPAPSGPRPFRWTVQEFHDANEQRVFGEGRRVILLHGELVELGPMNPPHAAGVRIANAVLLKVFAEGYFVQVQLPLVLGLRSDPIPDVAVVRGQLRDFTSTHPTTAALVLEVADSTLFIDTTTKAELYATAGIADYWVIDLQNRLLLVHRNPTPLPDGGMRYHTHLTLAPADAVSPLAAPAATIRVADLLP